MADVQLPFWIECVKALGAPIVACFAAVIAGVIAYRQSVVAQKKLKLDLFDRRIAIYVAAGTLITEMYTSRIIDLKRVKELGVHFIPSRWLLSEEVEKYLQNLVDRGARANTTKDVESVGLNEDQQFIEGFQSVERKKAELHKDFAHLDRLFEPYLTVQH